VHVVNDRGVFGVAYTLGRESQAGSIAIDSHTLFSELQHSLQPYIQTDTMHSYRTGA